MNDFEVNPRGYAEEIRLSRNAITKLLQHHQFDELHPEVLAAVKTLLNLYECQIEEGTQ